MKKKMIVTVSHAILLFVLCVPMFSWGTMAYIPHTVRECIMGINEMAEATDRAHNLQEVCAMIKENRILASDSMMQKAVKEAFTVIRKHRDKLRDKKHYAILADYLEKYRNSLKDASILLAMQGERAAHVSWPISFVKRSLRNSSIAMDMIHLNSELAATNNMQICGNGAYSWSSDDLGDVLKFWHFSQPTDPTLIFNANTMTSTLSTVPNVIFGTGVASPIINAWSLSPSTEVQSPVNVQFSIPADLDADGHVSLELHFLVKQQLMPAGKARVQVNAKYIRNYGDFNIDASMPSFSATNYSNDFVVMEPGSVDDVRHIFITVPLDHAAIKDLDFAFLSITRVEPEALVEYDADIYLASVAFRYTKQ